MSKRFTDTELWDKEWFMTLSLKQKCIVKFIRDKADLCGVWSPNFVIASAYIGEKITEKDVLSINKGNQFRKLANGKIYCVGFVEFQYGNVLSEKSPIHKKIIGLLESNGILDSYKKDNLYPINRVSNTLQEEEEEKEEEELKDKEKLKDKKSEIKIFEEPILSELEKTFNDFLEMRKKIKKEATPKAIELLKSKLYKLAPNNTDLQIQILNQSIIGCWQDIYPLKPKDNNEKESKFDHLQKVSDELDIRLGINQNNNNNNELPN